MSDHGPRLLVPFLLLVVIFVFAIPSINDYKSKPHPWNIKAKVISVSSTYMNNTKVMVITIKDSNEKLMNLFNNDGKLNKFYPEANCGEVSQLENGKSYNFEIFSGEDGNDSKYYIINYSLVLD